MLEKIRWFWQEAFAQKTPQYIYDQLISRRQYEQTINYVERIKSLRQALRQFSAQRFPTVLDMACGTGVAIEGLMDIEKRNIIGIDISSNMLLIAAKRFASYPKVRLRQMDFMDLELLPESFDLITFANSSRFIPRDQSQIFAELVYRHLKPDGRFFVALHRSVIQLPLVWTAFCLGKTLHFNMKLSWARYFVPAMRDYFELEQEIFLLRKHLLIDSVVLVMRKKWT